MFKVYELMNEKDENKEIEKMLDALKRSEEEEKLRIKYDNNRYTNIDYKIPEGIYIYSGKNKKIKREGGNFYFIEIVEKNKGLNMKKYGIRTGKIRIEKRMKNKDILERCRKNNVKILDFLECPRILVLEEIKNYPIKEMNYKEAFKAFHSF